MKLTNVGTQDIFSERLLLRKFCFADNASMRENCASDLSIQKLYSEPVYATEADAKKLLEK